MKLKLEPIESPESMKITPEKECSFYLLDAGFTEKEIGYIKKNTEKKVLHFVLEPFHMKI